MTQENRRNVYKLDQKFVDQLPLITNGYPKIYFDQIVKGFGVSVGRTAKSFILQREVNRRSVRVTIARTTEITVARAREEARNLLHKMRGGHNPNIAKRAAIEAVEKQNAVTLRHLLNQHVQSLDAKGFEYSVDNYPKMLKQYVPDWLDKPVASITREMVIERHRKIGTDNSQAGANKTFRIIRALLNQHRIDNPDCRNPVEILGLKKLWFIEKARDIRIQQYEMKPWIQALETQVTNPLHRDFMLFLLFTGLRRNEAARLAWEQVNFKGRSIRINKTKNKKPLELPMPDFIEAMLLRLWHMRDEEDAKTSKWVFPSPLSKSGHLCEPKKSLAAVNKHTSMTLRMHDLRRTFVSVATSIKISPYTIKKLINHSVSGDVTAAVYNVMSIEDLREPMQQITDQLKLLMGLAPQAQEKEINSPAPAHVEAPLPAAHHA